MKTRALLASMTATCLLASACSSGDATRSSTTAPAEHSSTGMSGHHMSADEMAAMRGPSQPAAMICSDEIRSAVQRTFHLTGRPTPTRRWSANDLTLTCNYSLPAGMLRMSVLDAPNERTGRPRFRRLRATLPGSSTIRGVPSFGFPAFETRSGNVVFLKDGKTLRVDASNLTRGGLPAGFTRTEAAYGVAAAVIACWTE